MRNDIKIYNEGAFGFPGSEISLIAASATTPTIKAGEPVAATLGSNVVLPMATSKPAVGTDYLVGIAMTDSTETASASGTVQVMKIGTHSSYLISPKVASAWNTQAKYDALVGARVTMDLTASAYTINASDSSANGLVVLPLDVTKHPAQVRFAFRGGVNYLS